MAQGSFLCWAMAGKAGGQVKNASLIQILLEQSPTYNIKSIFSRPFSAINHLLESDQLDLSDLYYNQIKHNGTRRALRL